MKSNILSKFALPNKHFQSLPDDRRVFFADFPWSGYYLIPDPSVESRLVRITFWTNLFLLISVVVIFGWLIFLRDSARYTGFLFWLIFLPLAGVTRWILYRNELRHLQKIDLPSVTSSVYQKLSEALRTYTKGSLPNYEIGLLLSIPNSEEKIVMLKYSEAFRNVLRCRFDGSILWQAELPTESNDVYTNVEWKDGQLHAFSRSCATVVLNENTGRIISGR
jgi:hypothetical protein